MSNDVVTLEQIRDLIKNNPDDLTVEKIFGKEGGDKYYRERKELEAIYARVDADREREKGWAAAASKPSDPGSAPNEPKKDELPAHLDPKRNPMIKIGDEFDPEKNEFLKIGKLG